MIRVEVWKDKVAEEEHDKAITDTKKANKRTELEKSKYEADKSNCKAEVKEN